MDKTKIAEHIVLYFHIGGGDKIGKWHDLAKHLNMPLSEQDIRFGMENVFHNNVKKWEDWKREGGIGMQLYGLRMFVVNAMGSLTKWPIPHSYEDEVMCVELNINYIVSHLRGMGIRIGSNSIWVSIKQLFA